MGFLSSLAGIFGIEFEALTDKLKKQAIVFGTVGLLLFVAVIFLLVAGYVALAQALGPLPAALIMAGGALLIALLVYLISRIGEGERERRERERRRQAEATTLAATAAATALPAMMRSSWGRGLGLPVLVIGGFLVMRALRRGPGN